MIPRNRANVSVAEILREEYMIPFGMQMEALADKADISHEDLRQLLDNKITLTIEMANKLADCFGTTVQFWLNLARLTEDSSSILESQKEKEFIIHWGETNYYSVVIKAFSKEEAKSKFDNDKFDQDDSINEGFEYEVHLVEEK